MTDRPSLLKLLGYPEHCVYSERVCHCPNLYRPDKWHVYARSCIEPSYFRQNLYIQRYIFGHKCICKTKHGAWWDVYQLALPSTQYPEFRSRPSTPLGHVADNLCYVFIFCRLKLKKNKFKLNGVISFRVLKTIQIDIVYMFLCSLFQKLWWNR